MITFTFGKKKIYKIIWVVPLLIAIATFDVYQSGAFTLVEVSLFILAPLLLIAFFLNLKKGHKIKMIIDEKGIFDQTLFFGRSKFYPWSIVDSLMIKDHIIMSNPNGYGKKAVTPVLIIETKQDYLSKEAKLPGPLYCVMSSILYGSPYVIMLSSLRESGDEIFEKLRLDLPIGISLTRQKLENSMST